MGGLGGRDGGLWLYEQRGGGTGPLGCGHGPSPSLPPPWPLALQELGRWGPRGGAAHSSVSSRGPQSPPPALTRPPLSPAPEEAPTIVSVTPHTTTSVLIRWQVRPAQGGAGTRAPCSPPAGKALKEKTGRDPPSASPLPPSPRLHPSDDRDGGSWELGRASRWGCGGEGGGRCPRPLGMQLRIK